MDPKVVTTDLPHKVLVETLRRFVSRDGFYIGRRDVRVEPGLRRVRLVWPPVSLGAVPATSLVILTVFALPVAFVPTTGSGTSRKTDSQQGHADSGYERPAVISATTPCHRLLSSCRHGLIFPRRFGDSVSR